MPSKPTHQTRKPLAPESPEPPPPVDLSEPEAAPEPESKPYDFPEVVRDLYVGAPLLEAHNGELVECRVKSISRINGKWRVFLSNGVGEMDADEL